MSQIVDSDVTIDASTRLNEQGQLIVQQQLTNKTDEFASFDCMLFAPNRRRQRQQVLNLGRGRHTRTYILPRGEELIGTTLWLRAEEIDGERILNHRILVER